MVFAIQHTQARQQAAIQRKLDEVLRAITTADDRLIAVEEAPDEELEALADLNMEDRDRSARDHTVQGRRVGRQGHGETPSHERSREHRRARGHRRPARRRSRRDGTGDRVPSAKLDESTAERAGIVDQQDAVLEAMEGDDDQTS